MHYLGGASSKGHINQGHKIQELQNPRQIIQGYNILSSDLLQGVCQLKCMWQNKTNLWPASMMGLQVGAGFNLTGYEYN
jgi:hypothetical protein